MIVIGLTGSIGMGKTTTAALFEAEGVPVHDADAAVHALYAKGGAAVEAVGAAFPGVVVDGAVDRSLLGARVLNDAGALRQLEEIVHPLTTKARHGFLADAHADEADIVVIDVPLLFETGGDKAVDAVVVVSAHPHIQRDRVMARPGMTEDKFSAILARQTSDAEKRGRAHYVIDTSHGVEVARDQVRAVLRDLRAKA